MTILVADDDPAVLRLVIRILKRAGLRVATAGTGADLLKAWRRLHCGLVLSDIMMPGRLDGIEACRTIRDCDPSVQIFMMTGDPIDGERAKAAGLKVALSKPFLLEDVTHWLKRVDFSGPGSPIEAYKCVK